MLLLFGSDLVISYNPSVRNNWSRLVAVKRLIMGWGSLTVSFPLQFPDYSATEPNQLPLLNRAIVTARTGNKESICCINWHPSVKTWSRKQLQWAIMCKYIILLQNCIIIRFSSIHLYLRVKRNILCNSLE